MNAKQFIQTPVFRTQSITLDDGETFHVKELTPAELDTAMVDQAKMRDSKGEKFGKPGSILRQACIVAASIQFAVYDTKTQKRVFTKADIPKIAQSKPFRYLLEINSAIQRACMGLAEDEGNG